MRRIHTKSRLGCRTCKRRKVKCDETRPHCEKCLRFGVNCDFPTVPTKPVLDDNRVKPSGKGRPRLDWAAWAKSCQGVSDGKPPASSETTPRLNVADLELYHHYMTVTSASLGNEDALWREGAPLLGFQYPCILDLILAFSSYHLARLRPSEGVRFLELAEQHWTAALKAATLFLGHVDPDRSPALYIISVLVCFTALARGPKPGNLLLVADGGEVPWLSLLRGVKLIIDTTGWSAIFSGPLAQYYPRPDSSPAPEQSDSMEGKVEVGMIEDWRKSLLDARSLADACPDQDLKAAYIHELEALEATFVAVFGSGRHARVGAIGEFQRVISWVYCLKGPFISGLQRRDYATLVMLGHFCVLLCTLPNYWFVEGWAEHVMNEILQAPGVNNDWLAWPRQYLSRYKSISAGKTA